MSFVTTLWQFVVSVLSSVRSRNTHLKSYFGFHLCCYYIECVISFQLQQIIKTNILSHRPTKSIGQTVTRRLQTAISTATTRMPSPKEPNNRTWELEKFFSHDRLRHYRPLSFAASAPLPSSRRSRPRRVTWNGRMRSSTRWCTTRSRKLFKRIAVKSGSVRPIKHKFNRCFRTGRPTVVDPVSRMDLVSKMFNLIWKLIEIIDFCNLLHLEAPNLYRVWNFQSGKKF